MNGLTWIDIVCPRCGETFEGLDFWVGTDVACNRCGRVQYRERMEAIQADRAYRVNSLGGACPTQSEGITAGGKPFYFRARHGGWTLHFGMVGDPPDYGKWADWSELAASGEDPTGGFMEDSEVLAILDQHCGPEAS